jgi:hypothetical protein
MASAHADESTRRNHLCSRERAWAERACLAHKRQACHTGGRVVNEGYRKPFSVSLLTGVSVPQ